MAAMITLTFLAFSALQTQVTALGLPFAWKNHANHDSCQPHGGEQHGWPAGARPDLAQYMPTVAGLPSNSNVTLKYAAVGLGVQNYTCASTSAAPVAHGALAVLYDASVLFARDHSTISDITTDYLHAYEAESCTRFGKPPLADDCCEDRVDWSQERLRTLGHHYFVTQNGKGVPFFDLSNTPSKDRLHAQLISSVKPATTPQNKGADGQGAVGWLFLTADGSGQSSGLSEVYRVQTAGGVPDPNACQSGQKEFGVKYAAEYWFFE